MSFIFVREDSFPLFEIGCELTKRLLEAGCDYGASAKIEKRVFDKNLYQGCNFRLIHWLALAKQVHGKKTDSIESFQELVTWLDLKGESLASAQDDLSRWRKWIKSGQNHLIDEEYRKSKKTN